MRLRNWLLIGSAGACGMMLGFMPLISPRQASAVVVYPTNTPDPVYDGWIADTLAKVDGDDERDQNTALDQLSLAIVTPTDRGKVLDCLLPHLNSTNVDFRHRCVVAYAHWATGQEAQVLFQVVLTPETANDVGRSESIWVTVVSGLVNLDPASARSAIQRRQGDFFFRVGMTQALNELCADTGPAQPDAFDMLYNLDKSDVTQMSLDEAISLLKNDAAGDKVRGAQALAIAVLRPDHKDAVLQGLQPHLMGNNGHARLPFVQAFSHWATPQEIPTLQAIIAYPTTVSGISGHEDCWAAATVGLLRLDPQAAAEAMHSRADAFFYRTSLHHDLESIAKGNGPNAAIASWLLSQIGDDNNAPPIPAGFDPGK
jgi:hypothetical protein